MIYPVDSVIQRLNNWGQIAKTSISDIQKFQIIQRKHAPGPPYQKAILSH